MRVNVIAMLNQAANLIDEKRDVGAYSFMLKELASDFEKFKSCELDWDCFIDQYCLNRTD